MRRVLEYLADLASQGGWRKRLRDEVGTRRDAVMNHGVFRIARRVQHTQVWRSARNRAISSLPSGPASHFRKRTKLTGPAWYSRGIGAIACHSRDNPPLEDLTAIARPGALLEQQHLLPHEPVFTLSAAAAARSPALGIHLNVEPRPATVDPDVAAALLNIP